MKVLMLVNPSAGGGTARRKAGEAAELMRGAGADLEIAESESAEHLTELAAAGSRSDADRIAVVGGDGAWHYALNGMAQTGRPAALIPCGRGNDFWRNIDGPPGLRAAVDLALGGTPAGIDLVQTGRRYYVGVAGVGFDSEVNECANNQVPVLTGPLAYTAAVFYKLFAFKPKRIRVVHDQGVFDGPAMFAVFANSKSYGAGMKIAPMAEMTDGLIDLLIIRRVGVPTLLTLLPKVFSGGHLPHPAIQHHRTTRVEVGGDRGLNLWGDGEFITPAPAALEITPGALTAVVPEAWAAERT